MPQLKVQNFYSTALTSDIVGIGDTLFTVAVAPTFTSGFLVISPNNASLREIVYFHNVVGNTVSVRAENRGQGGTTARAHTSSEPVAMKDIAEIFNMFSDSISQCFFVEKTGGLTIKVWGGTVFYNGNPVTVADTVLTLADNQTNYVKYDYPTNTISVDTTNSGNIKARVTTVSGAITSIQYYVAKESYIDFAISITGALPSQGGNAGKALVTNGTNVSWGTPNLPRTIGANKGIDVDRSTGIELFRDVVDVTSFNDTDILRARNTSNQYEDITFANLRSLFSDLSTEYAGEVIASQDVLANDYIRAQVNQYLRFGELTTNQKRGFVFTYSGTSGDVKFFIGRSTAFTENIDIKFYANNNGVPGTLIDTRTISSSTLNPTGTADMVYLVSVTPNLTSKVAGDEIFVEVTRTGSLNSTNFFYLGCNNSFTDIYFRHYFYNGTVWSSATYNQIPVFGNSVVTNMAIKYNSTVSARSMGLGVASSAGIIGQGISCVKRGLATITGISNGQAYKTLGNGTLTPVTTIDTAIAVGYAIDKILVPFTVAKYVSFVNTSIITLVIPVKAGDTIMVYGQSTAGSGGGVTNTTVTGPGISLSWAPGFSTYDFNGTGVANADGNITIQQGSFTGSTITVNAVTFLKK